MDYKKMIAMAGALACVSAFAVESANVVGYNNTAAGENLNWYAPVFRSLGENTTDIQDINLNDGGTGSVGMGDSMQIVGPLGNAIGGYSYWVKDMDMTGTVSTPYFWADDSFNPVSVSFDSGEGIAIDNANALTFDIVSSGEVSTNNVTFAAQSNLNWCGNPFPSAIDISAIQLDDDGSGVVGMGDSMQIVGPMGNAIGGYSYWVKDMDMTGTVTAPYFWADDSFNPVSVTLEPGQGFAIDNANGLEFNITITCPYTL